MLKRCSRSMIVVLAAIFVMAAMIRAVYAAVDFTSVATDDDGNTYLASDNVFDVFFYNTREDSDEGAWRKDLNAQETSWYDELIKSTRGDKNEFPEYAYLIVTDAGLDIIDAAEQKLWMRFEEGNNYMIPDGDHYAAFGLNGKVYVASNTRLSVIDFINDNATYYDASDDYTTTSTIATRNEAASWSVGDADPIGDSICNDVSGAVIGSTTYIATATESGVSVINESTGDVYDYYDAAANDDTNDVILLADGTLYYTNESEGDLEVYYDIQDDVGDQSSPGYNYDAASTPALLANPGATRYGLFVTENTSLIDSTRNTIYLGSANGLSVVQENANPNESNGSVKYYTISYITEEMIGDVRGMWTLEDDAGDFQDRSVKNNDLTDNAAVTRDVAAVRGEGVTLTAASSQYLSRAYDADFDFGTSDFSFTGWFRHPDTSGGQVMLADRTDGSTIGWQVYIDTSGNLVGRVSDDGTNWDTSTSSIQVDDDNWYQFALVWDQDTALTIYVNGVERGDDSALATVGSISGTTPTLEFGRDNGGSEYWDGELDELMITAEALTPQQVWNIYHKAEGARVSTSNNYLAGSSNIVKGVAASDDGRLLWTGTNSGGEAGALSLTKIGELGDYSTSVVIDTLNSDSTFNSFTTGTSPAIISNDISSVSMGWSQQREFLIVGTAASGATGMIQGYNWYSASDSYIHGGVMDIAGSCKTSPTYQICDSFGQVFAGDTKSSASYTESAGYEYDDRDAPVGPILIVSSPTTDPTPHWQWENTWDRNGVEGYYIKIGTSDGGEEFMAERWLGYINHWEQDTAFDYPGTYYAKLKVRDKVGNEGAWGQTTAVVIQPSLTFVVEGVDEGTADLGSGTDTKETTDVSTFSNVIDFGTLPINEPTIAAQKLIMNMNVGEGYVVTFQHDHEMQATTNDEDVIASFSGTNDFPTYWTSSPLGHLGYHSDDDTLNNVGNGPDRFRGFENKYAGLTVDPEEVMYSDTIANNDEIYVVYKIQISPTLLPGEYKNQINYIATATY